MEQTRGRIGSLVSIKKIICPELPQSEGRISLFGIFLFGLFWFCPDIKTCSDMKNMNRVLLSHHILMLFTFCSGCIRTGLQVILGVRSQESRLIRGQAISQNRQGDFVGCTCQIQEPSLGKPKEYKDSFKFPANANCYNLSITCAVAKLPILSATAFNIREMRLRHRWVLRLQGNKSLNLNN